MVSDLKKEIEKVKESKEYKDFISKNKKSYLATCFLFYENIKDAVWQIDYYNPEEDNMVIFLCKKELEFKGPEKIVKKKKDKITELDLKKVKLDFEKVMVKIEQFKTKKYKDEIPNKTIVILQSSKKNPIWNISFLTTNSNILNIKLDASNGKILEHKLNSILKFKA